MAAVIDRANSLLGEPNADSARLAAGRITWVTARGLSRYGPGFGDLLIVVMAALFARAVQFPPLAWFGVD